MVSMRLMVAAVEDIFVCWAESEYSEEEEEKKTTR